MEIEKVKVKCAGCSKPAEAKPLAKDQNGRDLKKVWFICRSCGAHNLRNGTARYLSGSPAAQSVTTSPISADDPKKEEKEVLSNEQIQEENQDSKGYGFF